MPQTVLVFRSVSRRSLKIIVLCMPKEGELPQTAEDYEQFLREAQQQAAKYYSAFCDCQINQKAETLHRGCRMSQDAQLYYNRDAEPLTIIHKDNSPLRAYPHAHTDSHGWTESYMTSEQQEKERADFYTCQRKAFKDYVPESDDKAIQEDGRMTLLAQYCRKSALPEESSVRIRQEALLKDRHHPHDASFFRPKLPLYDNDYGHFSPYIFARFWKNSYLCIFI